MEPETSCDFVGCILATGNLICQVIGSESVDYLTPTVLQDVCQVGEQSHPAI